MCKLVPHTPAVTPPNAHDTFTSIPPPAPSGTPGDKRARVGVAVARSELGVALEQLLRRGGYDAVHVGPADLSVPTLTREPPDILVVDAALKTPSAFELCGELRATEAGRHIPLVFVAEPPASELLAARSLLCGADDFCVLTERGLELLARLRVQVRIRSTREALHKVRTERDAYREASNLDPLTGILNRRSLDDVVANNVAARTPFGLLFLDIDHFKSVNDRFGHDQGDVVIRMVAECLKRQARPSDFCGRYGGEEFVVVAMGLTTETAPIVAERHRKAISLLKPPVCSVTSSVGVAVFDPSSPDSSALDLYKRADSALYEAKRMGRNRVVVAAAHAPPPASKEGLEPAVLEALAKGRAGLPVLPDAARDALRLARDAQADLRRIALLVDRDPPLAARFLALANSSAYGRGLRIASTQAALVRLGLTSARDLLMQVALERSRSGLKEYRTEVEASFRRSLVAGFAAREAARVLGEATEDAYLCGLLHDIGEARIYRVLSELPGPHDPAEVARIVRKHHAAAGAQVARTWGLPEAVVSVCERHHDPDSVDRPEVRIVMVADVVTDALERSARAVIPSHLVGVTEDLIEAVRIRVADRLARLDVGEDASKDSSSGPARIASRVMRAVQPPKSEASPGSALSREGH